MKWRIYYSDGSTYSSTDGSPFDAPGRGVEVIVSEDEAVGRTIQSHRDYYWWADDIRGWWGGEIFGMYDYLISAGPRKVIFGRSMRDDEFNALYQRAMNDPDFPPKTALARSEAKR